MQQSTSSADFIPLIRKIPYLCFDNPRLRKGSAVTPGMVLDDKLDVFQWELKRGFITSKDLPNGIGELVLVVEPREKGRSKKPSRTSAKSNIPHQRLSEFSKLAEIPIHKSPCPTIAPSDNNVAVDGLFNTLR